VSTLSDGSVQPAGFCGMVGDGPAMRAVFGLIRRLALHARAVLVTGETGTGKELVARTLHQLGPRSRKRFVAVNCSAVVESLFESGLFGHLRGSFTGATEHKAGLVETADGGTLFLDEVGELPAPVQANLLRVLENGELQRIGALKPRQVDVRLIAATNRDLRVRQLRNLIERACMLAESGELSEGDLAEAVDDPFPVLAPGASPSPELPLRAVERDHITRTLSQAGGNKAVAARLLGISRRALYRQLERHGLRVPPHSTSDASARTLLLFGRMSSYFWDTAPAASYPVPSP
jgi:transcriptional regulator with GAF, ATPase, and Fis domain